MQYKILLLIIFVANSLHSFSQNADVFVPDSVKKEIDAIQIHGSLSIDGLLNEPEWKLAKASPRFVQVEPVQGNPAGEQTDVKVLYNRQYLYFGIFAHDSLGKNAIRTTDFKRDFDDKSRDLVSIALDCFNDQRNAMVFVTGPYGVQRDLLSFDDLYYDVDWNGLWKVRTNRTDSGWTAEIAIPWQTLRYPNKTDSVQQWGLSIYRNRRITNEITSFSPYPRAFTALRMNYAGILKNLKPPSPKTNIRFEPYILSSYDHYKGFDSSQKVKET
ncbi:MAG TPA: carbohydrate binding family 9 domain-containing protein, partial [Hanamia sp.]|nr:carbohydrate binding family 9 domain-containing protein [Hanamia sp.]